MIYRLLAVTLLGGLLASCSASAPSAETEEVTDDASASGYFTVRRDFRRCAYPMCGGFWVKRANQTTTTCPGGAGAAEECYVVDIDASSIGDDIETSAFSVVRGRFSTRRINGARYGFLNASELWSAGSDQPASGTFYRLEDNGVTCIAAPCMSVDAQRLNSSSRPSKLSDLDLSGSGATSAEQRAALAALEGPGLIAAGFIQSVPNAGPAGAGRTLIASQYFTRYEHDANTCDEDTDCGWSGFIRPVSSSADCYCPGCPVPMANATAAANEASWAQYCGHIRCAGPRCAPLTEAVCAPQGSQGVCGAE